MQVGVMPDWVGPGIDGVVEVEEELVVVGGVLELERGLELEAAVDDAAPVEDAAAVDDAAAVSPESPSTQYASPRMRLLHAALRLGFQSWSWFIVMPYSLSRRPQ